jgi:hypothetical protein
VNKQFKFITLEYDEAGNLKKKTGPTAPFTAYYEYDGDNRIRRAKGGSATVVGASYFYDGDGRGIKKIVSTATSHKHRVALVI